MQLIEDRRALHRIPELDRQLPQTMAYLLQVNFWLEHYGINIQ